MFWIVYIFSVKLFSYSILSLTCNSRKPVHSAILANCVIVDLLTKHFLANSSCDLNNPLKNP